MWLFASRGRPKSVERFLKQWKVTGASTIVILCLDKEDETLPDYLELDYPANWIIRVEDRKEGYLADVSRRAFKDYPNEDFYGWLSDDLFPITYEWDVKLIEAAKESGYAWCDDGMNGMKHAAHPCMSGDFVRDLGWICLPGLKHLYIDNALFEMAKRKGCLHYLGDVKVEHWHFATGKSEYDKTYEKPTAAEDKEVYKKWLQSLA